KAPKYCLLVFGLQADRRLWLVLDGDTLFVDTNGNGDLTEAGKKVKVETLGRETSFEEVDVLDRDGVTKHRLRVSVFGVRNLLRGKGGPAAAILNISWKGKQTYVVWGDEQGPLTFGSRPSDAPVVHIGGLLQMGLEMRTPLVKKSDETYELNAAV